MLKIYVKGREWFNNKTNEFLETKDTELVLEHSLVAISKWESKWKKPFLSNERKTDLELKDYIKCMTISQNIDPLIYESLTLENFKAINEYINDSMTATTINSKEKGNGKEMITSEIIYYWMVSLNIPTEFQKWHLNRLLTLIRVVNEKQNPGKKMTNQEIYSQNKALNKARRAKYKSRG